MAPKPAIQIGISKVAKNAWSVNIWHRNGRLLFSSVERYSRRGSAQRAIKSLVENIQGNDFGLDLHDT